MSLQLDSAQEPPTPGVGVFHAATTTTTTTASRSPLPPLRAPVVLATRSPFSSPSSSPITSAPPPTSCTAVPLDRYRAKLEECAALHRTVDALTQDHEACQRHLAEEKATNAQLRKTIAELQRVLQSGKRVNNSEAPAEQLLSPAASVAFPATTVTAPVNGATLALRQPTESPGDDTSQRAGLESSAPAHQGTSALVFSEEAPRGVGRPADLLFDYLENPHHTSPPFSGHSPCSMTATARHTAPTACKTAHFAEEQLEEEQQHSPASSSASAQSSQRSPSLLQSASSSQHTREVEDVGRSRRHHSAHTSAAEATAYVRAMSEILAAPLGPWEV
jgi:hypothetical protein